MANAAAPKLECNLVMRGGITSGIVYLRAIARLAETIETCKGDDRPDCPILG
jgi:hypothetical protein